MRDLSLISPVGSPWYDNLARPPRLNRRRRYCCHCWGLVVLWERSNEDMALERLVWVARGNL